MSFSAIDLATELIRFDTINPPGQEAARAEYLAHLLIGAGFQCETVPLDEGRPNPVGDKAAPHPRRALNGRHSLPAGGRGCVHDPGKPPRAALPILRTDRYAART
jgi:succinyl-diaminopimelate desuccinylase